MKLLLVDASTIGREAMTTAFRATRHSVESFGSLDGAIRRLSQGGADVLAFAAPSGAADFVRRVRGIDARSPYLIFVTPAVAAEHLDPVFAAGLDDFVRAPANADELRSRVDGAERRARVAAAPRAAMTFTEQASDDRIGCCASWLSLPTTVATELAGMVGSEAAVYDQAPLSAAGPIAARIVCSLPAERVEVVMSLTMADAALERVGEAMLGTTPDAAMKRDLLQEMANGASGAFKRAALSDGFSYTLGLPSIEKTAPKAWYAGKRVRTWVVSCRDQGVHVLCRAEIRSLEPARVLAAELAEGMILAVDLLGPNGALLASSGTRITASNAERLIRFLGPKHPVQITGACAA